MAAIEAVPIESEAVKSPRSISLDVARRMALGAQGFGDPAPSGRVDRRHLRRAMARMRVVQLDSIPIVARTQYLPFHSRLGPYDMALLDRVAYRDDEWFELWAHEASIMPVDVEPLFRWMTDRARSGHTWKSLHQVSVREPAYVEAVLAEVRERGAVTGGELSDPRPLPKDGSGWWNRSLGVLALDWLYRVGELGVRRRGNFEKVFSPIEDIVPKEILDQPTPAPDDAVRELTKRSVQALGVGTAKGVADYFRLPIKMVRPALDELVESGAIDVAEVESWNKPAFVDPKAVVPRRITGATVLSPFDPVVWNRDRAERIWGFEYRIEIYVPAAKRRWGYYVLPVMVDGDLVARLDVKTDRDASVLRIKAAYAEPGHATPAVAARVRSAIEDLRVLVRVDEVDVADRGDLAPHLR